MKTDTTFLQARRALLLDHCFFGSLVMHLSEVADKGAKKGLWVDGASIGYNPQTMDDLPLEQGAGLIAKGVLHCALGHHLRRGIRDLDMWQKACDYVTNPHIITSGLQLPAGALIDRQYIDQNLSAEQVYLLLEQDQQNQPQQQQPGQKPGGGGQGSAPPQTGEVRDLPGDQPGQSPSESEMSNQEQEWKIAMQQALMNADSRGDLPASLKRLIEKELQPRISWKEELRRFMQTVARNDVSWARPNRRFIGQGLYLPSLKGVQMGAIVIAVDTSGSINANILAAFEAEINAILEDTMPEITHVVYCDAKVAGEAEFRPDDLPIKLQPVGGGGTKFTPVFEWVADNLFTPPACLIYLTDTYGTFPQQEPDYPVLWASTAGDKVPFGDLIKIDLSQQERF